MGEFTSEALTILLTIITFGLLLTMTFWVIPQVTDIMIRVAEGMVM